MEGEGNGEKATKKGEAILKVDEGPEVHYRNQTTGKTGKMSASRWMEMKQDKLLANLTPIGAEPDSFKG